MAAGGRRRRIEVLAVTALGRIPENSRVTKACYEWNREGEKNARGEENIRRRRTRVSGPDARVPLVTSFRGPPRRHAEKGLGAKTRAWQPLLVNEDRGSLCNLCNRSRERSERRRHALRFSFLNASSADPRCRFLSSPLRYRRYRLSFYSLSLSLSLAASLESRRSETPYPGRLVRSTLSRSSQRANHRRWNIHSRRRNNTNTCCTQNSCRASSSLERFLVASCLLPSPLPHIDLDPLTAFRFVSISIRSPRRSHSLLSSGCPFNLFDSTMGRCRCSGILFHRRNTEIAR